ncbi:MAG: hypothetical protein RMJ37_00070 [Spirochaetia bacterium]|nr:hypothetical protein [Spirochaetota bacterium]MCX8096191.1 hypothetical protein [Spirochaetota bacterium]MDW8111723.1 hypothetical protein [Spirochaetia bacterium]
MDFLLSLLIVIAVSAAFGFIWNFVSERFYGKSVLLGYWGAIALSILGGVIGFYYLGYIVNFLVMGTNINFIAVLLGASIVLYIAARINPSNR